MGSRITADGGDERDYAEVVEITELVDLSSWPAGTRMIARLEDPHPGAQLTFTDIDGHRFQVFVTDLTDADIAYLEALYLAWSRRLILDGDLARAEPKRLRYCLLHTAGVIVRSGRQRWLRAAEGWPWADEVVAAFERTHSLPLRT